MRALARDSGGKEEDANIYSQSHANWHLLSFYLTTQPVALPFGSVGAIYSLLT